MQIPKLPDPFPIMLVPDVDTRNAAERRAHVRGDDELYLIAELWGDAIALAARIKALEGAAPVAGVSVVTAPATAVWNPRAGHQTVTDISSAVHVDLSSLPALSVNYVVDCFILDAGGTRFNANWIPSSNALNGFDVDCSSLGELYWLMSDPNGNQYTSRSGHQTVTDASIVNHVDVTALPFTKTNYVVECWILDASNPATKLVANWIPSSNALNGFDVDPSAIGELYWILVYSS